MISMTISCMSVARYRYVVPLLDPHAPQLPVKPGKSRQIVANETAAATLASWRRSPSFESSARGSYRYRSGGRYQAPTKGARQRTSCLRNLDEQKVETQ